MSDLFGSTNFIEFSVLDTILSNINILNKLLAYEENKIIFEEKFSFIDYISNLDSYLYALMIIPPEDIISLKKWIKNYINYLYIPLIEEDSMYILKSKVIQEIYKIKNKTSKINENLKNLFIKEIYRNVDYIIKNKQKEIKRKIYKKGVKKDYVTVYYNIYNL